MKSVAGANVTKIVSFPARKDHDRRTLTSRREALALISTGAAHLFFENVMATKWEFMLCAFAAWSVYLVRQTRRGPAMWEQWGFRWEHFAATFACAGIVFIVGAITLAGIAIYRGEFVMHWHMLPLLVVYPLWGLPQQFLLQALLTRNFVVGVPWLRSPWRVIPLAASLFALAHWPDTILVGATFLLGLAFTPMYLRWRNLWPLGLFHGWLGALTYFWLLGRDPWVELLG
ncbi:MAG: CPBP family glutamic-type intramembrane protease [Candidatus Binatia bacterium]